MISAIETHFGFCRDSSKVHGLPYVRPGQDNYEVDKSNIKQQLMRKEEKLESR